MTQNENEKNYISIGGLATGSGVPVETIRNWELRYGFPKPIRLDSGHRRYHMDLIPQLRKIKTLVDAGYKPSFAVNQAEDVLEKLLINGAMRNEHESSEADSAEDTIRKWLALTEVMNVAEFTRALERNWHQIGARRFIFELALPFLRDVGVRWEQNILSVAHEHFSSEVLQTFLAAKWRPLVSANHKRKLLLANQEGELHSLGLHMAAILATLHNIEPVFLGPNTPLSDIVSAAKAQKVSAVIIGFSSVSNPQQAVGFLKDLQQGLLGIRVAFGGNNSLPDISDIEYLQNLE